MSNASDVADLDVDGIGAPLDLGRIRAEIRIVDEIERIRELRLRLRSEGQLDVELDEELERTGLDDAAAECLEVPLRVLRAARLGMVRHPAAAASVFRALVAEGERVAATPEGRRRAVELASSPVMNDLRRIWEATTLNMLGDAESNASAIPAGWIDLVLDAIIAGDAGDLAGRLTRPE